MALVEQADFLRGYSAFLPGLAVSVIAAILLGRRVGRWLGAGWAIGFGLVLALGLILSATVTPGDRALVDGIAGSGSCDLGRIGLPSAAELVWPGEALLNALLFIPLGAAIGLSPPSRARTLLAVAALALPFAIELVQLEVARLGRQCQSEDVVDNLVGLAIGFALVIVVRAIVRPLQRERTGEPAG